MIVYFYIFFVVLLKSEITHSILFFSVTEQKCTINKIVFTVHAISKGLWSFLMDSFYKNMAHFGIHIKVVFSLREVEELVFDF